MNEQISFYPSMIVDIDSTLYDALPVFCSLMRSRHGIMIEPIDIVVWDFWKEYEIPLPEWLALIRDGLHTDASILGVEPYPGVVSALRLWYDRGCELHLVSDRDRDRYAPTAAWLAKHKVPVSHLVCEPGIDKIRYAIEHGIDIIIDDRPLTLIAAREAGMMAATIRHPFNADLLAQDHSIIAADDWYTLRMLIEQHLGGDR
jgi:FMN phosphatase YigB (HAD superfamily)